MEVLVQPSTEGGTLARSFGAVCPLEIVSTRVGLWLAAAAAVSRPLGMASGYAGGCISRGDGLRTRLDECAMATAITHAPCTCTILKQSRGSRFRWQNEVLNTWL